MESKPSTRPSIKAVLAEVARGEVPGSGMTEAEYSALGALAGIPAPLVGVVMSASEALERRLNFASKKSLERTFAAPYEAVLKAFVLALQAQKLRMTVAFDTAHGACVEADLPNDMFSRGGTLSFSIADGAASTTISGTSEISGQRFDWGKGNRTLGDLFAKTERYIGTLGA
ncbi:MAG: hypothetical protein M3R53_08445 [Candidatus Eremiobacteraeota bacterium]|nr:hypothetical protein [Candidatus Eremiobacteraeota bacterium]